MNARRLAWVSAVLAVWVAGCGGKSESSSGPNGEGGAAGNDGGATGGTAGTGGSAAGGSGGSATGGAGGTAAGGSAGTSTGGSGGAPSFDWGGCDPAAPACGPGSTCVQVSPAAFYVCTTPTPDPTVVCDPNGGGPGPDPCCAAHTDCAPNELCVSFTAGMGEWNQCLGDSCSSDADCTQGFCAPRGVLGAIVRSCLPASCTSDADCVASPDGRCAPVTAGQIGDCATVGLFCVYPSLGGCVSHANCLTGAHCEADSGTKEARCVAGAPEECPPVAHP